MEAFIFFGAIGVVAILVGSDMPWNYRDHNNVV
jgi:hypothetical protein